jgi:hypothetical protein
VRLFAALLALSLASSALAQEAAPAPAVNPQELMDEARLLQATLEAVQAKALGDESLAGKADALVRDVEARMAELEPLTPARLDQLEKLRVAAQTAAAAENRDSYESAVTEARTVQQSLDATRQLVLAEEAYMLRTVALQRELVDTMTVIEPKVPQLLRRLGDISRSLGTP